jgi:hypothetical protein
MAKGKSWFRYTDESGKCWRIKVAPDLAEIGGLRAIDETTHPLLPEQIKPRYIWIKEAHPPADRLPARYKIILEKDRLKEIWCPGITWEVAGKTMAYLSYYGETVYAK